MSLHYPSNCVNNFGIGENPLLVGTQFLSRLCNSIDRNYYFVVGGGNGVDFDLLLLQYI